MESTFKRVNIDEEVALSKEVALNSGQVDDQITDSFQLYEISRKFAQKEIVASSLVYSMRRKMNFLYNQHLRLIKPILNKYPSFWKSLEKSEQNAKAFTGWLNHMKKFYDLLMKDSKYQKALVENKVNLTDLKQAYILIPAIQQSYRNLLKCQLQKRIANRRLKDFDSISGTQVLQTAMYFDKKSL
ncbi:hypothetical protein [Marinifilum sp.]|uniref:hypothetical protein n=1 Tax=Marinifilum sp. TaxID=2033137 RepID=UPI003BA9BE0B